MKNRAEKAKMVEKTGKFPRNRQRKWDNAHMKTVSTKLTRREYAEFRARCAARATTPYAVMQELLRGWY